MRLTKKVTKLLTWERVCRVATTSAAGVPHVVPVCPLFAGGKLYFASDATARKVRNLRANPRVAIAIDLYAEDWSQLKGVTITGNARLIARSARFRQLRARLYRKVPRYPAEAALDVKGTVIVELTPTRVFTWGMD